MFPARRHGRIVDNVVKVLYHTILKLSSLFIIKIKSF